MFRKKKEKHIEDQTWYVVFCDSEEIEAPFKWFTCEGFRHVFCFAESPSGSLIMNYIDYHCEVRIGYGKSATEMAFGFVDAGCVVLKVKTQKRPGLCLRGLIYCVPLTKAFLGIRGCWAVTPLGLHNWLKKSNLSVIDLNKIAENVMGKTPKQPAVDPELKKQREQELMRAEREEERLRKERIAGADRARRKQTGIFQLLKTKGGELGAPRTLLSGKSS